MRCYGIILLILLGATCCSAQQNLILNGRFEETVSPDSCYTGPICKDVFVGLNSRHFIRDWWNPTNVSPDYFNRCDTSNLFGVPYGSGLVGYQEDPLSGDAYVGFATYWSLAMYDEQVTTHLKESLIKGKQYEFRMLVNASDYSFYKTNIGFCLEKDSIDIDSAILYTPRHLDHIYMTDSFIKNCETWTEIIIDFSPTIDSLRFLTIGTFQSTLPISLYKSRSWEVCKDTNWADTTFAYYIIDDVRLYCLDCDTADTTDTIPHEIECSFAFPDAFSPNGDDMNDRWKPLMNEACDSLINNYLLRIFDHWGNEVFNTKNREEGWSGVNKEIGTYIYYLQYEDKKGIQKKTGSIILVR